MEKVTRHPDTEEIENGIYKVFNDVYMLIKNDVAYMIGSKGVSKFKKDEIMKRLHGILEYKDKNAITKRLIKIIFEGDKNV